MRESPSGKASAFQADIRGFESRLPLTRAITKKQARKSHTNFVLVFLYAV
jgi:hypothetical protein